MGLNVWTGCGTKVASEAGVNRFLRGIHQDWSSTVEIVEHKSVYMGWDFHIVTKHQEDELIPCINRRSEEEEEDKV
ncbi:hypothetical protein YC2023_028606 [Brassica napus]